MSLYSFKSKRLKLKHPQIITTKTKNRHYIVKGKSLFCLPWFWIVKGLTLVWLQVCIPDEDRKHLTPPVYSADLCFYLFDSVMQGVCSGGIKPVPEHWTHSSWRHLWLTVRCTSQMWAELSNLDFIFISKAGKRTPYSRMISAVELFFCFLLCLKDFRPSDLEPFHGYMWISSVISSFLMAPQDLFLLKLWLSKRNKRCSSCKERKKTRNTKYEGNLHEKLKREIQRTELSQTVRILKAKPWIQQNDSGMWWSKHIDHYLMAR